ncbi:hypothetical protein J6590_082129 [Homalodisca vitripennis]|nr:hypothetical protein J6590_082129 [Homalodisca vitripennis]
MPLVGSGFRLWLSAAIDNLAASDPTKHPKDPTHTLRHRATCQLKTGRNANILSFSPTIDVYEDDKEYSKIIKRPPPKDHRGKEFSRIRPRYVAANDNRHKSNTVPTTLHQRAMGQLKTERNANILLRRVNQIITRLPDTDPRGKEFNRITPHYAPRSYHTPATLTGYKPIGDGEERQYSVDDHLLKILKAKNLSVSDPTIHTEATKTPLNQRASCQLETRRNANRSCKRISSHHDFTREKWVQAEQMKFMKTPKRRDNPKHNQLLQIPKGKTLKILHQPHQPNYAPKSYHIPSPSTSNVPIGDRQERQYSNVPANESQASMIPLVRIRSKLRLSSTIDVYEADEEKS